VTTWHPTEEDLVLHFYGETGPDEERRVDEHVASCSACRQSWTELGETLKLVDAATVPEPGAGFERTMWARVQQALPEPQATKTPAWRWVPALGMAAAIVTAVGVGYAWRSSHEPRATAIPSAGAQANASAPAGGTIVRASLTDLQKTRERVLLTALNDHFQQTEVLLTELMNSPDEGRADIDFERQAADDLVASGRLYRVTAQQSGDLQLARMLDDLESVLVDVANSPEHVSRKDFQSLRTRIDDQNLLFKVRAVSNQIHERQKTLIPSE
jgi:hypothetical protein